MEMTQAIDALAALAQESRLKVYRLLVEAGPQGLPAGRIGDELEEIGTRLAQADVSTSAQKGANCCYAKSDKYWTVDPQGIAWESFHTLEGVPLYGEDTRSKAADKAPAAACCAH